MSNQEIYITYLKAHKLQVPISKLDVDTQKKYRKHLETTSDYMVYSSIARYVEYVKSV